MALAMEPSLLIADEAVSNLDVPVKASVLGLLKDINKKFNVSTLYISHNIATVWYICDRIYVINKVYIVEQGLSEICCFQHPKIMQNESTSDHEKVFGIKEAHIKLVNLMDDHGI